METGDTPRTFHPTLKEWNDLPRYMKYIESTGAGALGIVKIRAPAGWQPSTQDPAQLYNPSNITVKITSPLQQTIKPTPTRGAFESTSEVLPELSVENFVKLATSQRLVTPAHESYDHLEEIYWSYDTIDTADYPIYGADVQSSLIDDDRKIWNVSKGEYGQLFNDLGQRLTKVNEGAYLYFGMWKTTFSWHIEDMDLYGINYLHYGAPKSWYCVPPSQAYRLERYADTLFPNWANICKNFLRHKVCMMSPYLLRSKGITVNKVVQEERDLIVVFPHAYHAGFNHGFNIAEASNFGTPDWVEHGKRHRTCMCSDSDKVIMLDMEPFVTKYQPDRLDAWKAGQDEALHPDDPEELEDVWRMCKQVVECEGEEDLPQKLRERLTVTTEESEEQEEVSEKIRKLKSLCKKQLNHFKMFREVLVGLKEIVDIVEVDDWNDVNETKKEIETECAPLSLSDSALKKVKAKALKSKLKVRVKKPKKADIKIYLDKLPAQPNVKKNVKSDPSKQNIVTKLGFADITEEELLAKKNMMKCYYKHKFWNCKKCAYCLKPDCGRCWACKDKPKFGGPGVQKQKCQERKCSNPMVRGCDKCTWNVDYIKSTL